MLKPKMPFSDVPLVFRAPQKLVDEVQEIAEREGRSVSNFLRLIVEEGIKKRTIYEGH